MQKGIYIDLDNREQVEWFNKVGHKLIKVVSYNEIIETATNKVVGYCVNFRSLVPGYVIKKNNSFLGPNLKEMVVSKEGA